MAKEVRKVIFSEKDMFEAMVNYVQRSEVRLPSRARLIGFDILQDEHAGINLKFNFNDPEIKKEIILSQDEIGAAFIMHCKTKKIPLPREATKSLTTDGKTIALNMTVDWDEVERKSKD